MRRITHYIRYRLPRLLRFRLRIYYLSKFDVGQVYGGPEEGGWWYNAGSPVWRYSIPVPFWEEGFYMLCRWFNRRERARAEREEQYGYTSVLSHLSVHYSYGDDQDHFRPQPYPQTRPYYC